MSQPGHCIALDRGCCTNAPTQNIWNNLQLPAAVELEELHQDPDTRRMHISHAHQSSTRGRRVQDFLLQGTFSYQHTYRRSL